MNFVTGVPEKILPLVGFPNGRIRLRFRNTSIGRAFVKSETGIKCFIIGEENGEWKPYPESEQGWNEWISTRRKDVLAKAFKRAMKGKP